MKKRKIREAERIKREAEKEAEREAEEREASEKEKESEEDDESPMLRMAAMSVVSVDETESDDDTARKTGDVGSEESGNVDCEKETGSGEQSAEVEETKFKYSGKRNSLFLMVNSASNEQGPAALAAAALAGQQKAAVMTPDVIKEEYFANADAPAAEKVEEGDGVASSAEE